MRRIVLDTNVLVASAYDELSASWRIVEAVLRGELTALVSPPLRGEYEKILRAAVKVCGHEEQMHRLLATVEDVPLAVIPRVVPDDPEDDKVLATAVAGKAEAIITNDRHLLDLDPHEGIRILRPTAFEHSREDEGGEEWRDLATMIGIGR